MYQSPVFKASAKELYHGVTYNRFVEILESIAADQGMRTFYEEESEPILTVYHSALWKNRISFRTKSLYTLVTMIQSQDFILTRKRIAKRMLKDYIRSFQNASAEFPLEEAKIYPKILCSLKEPSVPHKKIVENIYVVYILVLPDNTTRLVTEPIADVYCQMSKITKKELYEQAMKHAMDHSVLEDVLTPDILKSGFIDHKELLTSPKIFHIRYKDHAKYGASLLADEKMLFIIKEKAGNGFYAIIPTKNDAYIFPAKNENEPALTKEEFNDFKTCAQSFYEDAAEDDRLSTKLFFYSPICEKFILVADIL